MTALQEFTVTMEKNPYKKISSLPPRKAQPYSFIKALVTRKLFETFVDLSTYHCRLVRKHSAKWSRRSLIKFNTETLLALLQNIVVESYNHLLRIMPPLKPAATAVLSIWELVEKILLNMPTRSLVLACRISRSWKTVIERSAKLQQHLFLSPAPAKYGLKWVREDNCCDPVIQDFTDEETEYPIIGLHPAVKKFVEPQYLEEYKTMTVLKFHVREVLQL